MCSIRREDCCTLREAMVMMGFDFDPAPFKGDRLVVKPDPQRKFCVRENGEFWSHCGGFSLCSFQKVFESDVSHTFYRGQGGFHIVIEVDRKDHFKTKMVVNESC